MSTETDTTDTTDTAEAPATDAGTEVDTGDEVLLPVLSITADALARVIEIRDAEDDPGSLCLRVGITGTNGAEYSYDLAFEEIAGVDEADDVSVQKGLTVVVAADSVERMRGATLDVPSRDGQGGLVIRNPNRPNPLSGRDIELTGDIADKVRQLLMEAINPSLASHGGYADLVGVEDTTVFLSMGGGCQGCAMSAATLREGIQVAIKEAIPEVTDIVDVTDHDAGASPFYS
jgi:Fe/S biogenesis protein NfuA